MMLPAASRGYPWKLFFIRRKRRGIDPLIPIRFAIGINETKMLLQYLLSS
jgi:hypothetical protein